jgi:serine/threonine protein kinase/Flp pilus assembly protein TadD
VRYCPTCKRCYPDATTACAADGAAAEIVAPGDLVLDGKYEMRRLLGRGGMGAVFEAFQHGIERRVAIKLINPALVADPQSRERFRREAFASGRIKHPHAITVYDYGVTSDEVAYMAMEFLEGLSLRDELRRRGPLGLERTLAIVEPACAAVDAAHRAGVVHRDLKPDNIFLESLEDGSVTVKVLDFGIAKLRVAPSGDGLVTDFGPIGTPAYMSPEQARGEDLDARSDVYSLGLVAYEMLVGRLPFERSTPQHMALQHMTAAPLPLSAALPGVPARVEAVVMRALEKSPDARPQSALDLARALAEAATETSFDSLGSAFGAFARVKRLAAQVVGSTSRLVVRPVGVVPGVPASTAASALSEVASEFVAAGEARIPDAVLFEAVRLWALGRLSPLGLYSPSDLASAPATPGDGTAGLALYCEQPGVTWCTQTPEGGERLLRLAPAGGGPPSNETTSGVASYWTDRLPGGRTLALVARLEGETVWSQPVAFAAGATTLVACAPRATAARDPATFTRLFGAVEVAVNEVGADVFVDSPSEKWGTTGPGGRALLYCVLPGVHRVVVRKEFFADAIVDLHVEVGRRATFTAAMKRGSATVRLSVNVPGTRVDLVGPEPGADVRSVTVADDPKLVPVDAGAYDVRASHDGYETAAERLVVAPDSEREHRVALRPHTCPVCGSPAIVDTFTCPACGRAHVHTGHRHGSGACMPCAARAAFGGAEADATSEAWKRYIDEFGSVDAERAARAEAERGRLFDLERERDFAERETRFAALAARGAIADVVSSWQAATAARPDDAEPRLALAMALEAAGNAGAARECYGAATALAPSDAVTRRGHGRALARLGLHEEACREYGAATRIRPDFALAHFELAQILATLGRRTEALDAFRAAAAANPVEATYWDAVGAALANLDRHREAGEAFAEASRRYRAAGNGAGAVAADERSRKAYEKTALGKAGRFLKDFLGR